MKTSTTIIIIAVILVATAGYFFLGNREKNIESEVKGIETEDGNTTIPPSGQMSFFVTSMNPGKGADLGGLQGADQFCQMLASNVGAGDRTWRAYLSATATGNQPAVNARDRIGNGPWRNSKGELIASNLEELHSNNNINKNTALTEKGERINGRGDDPNLHDILTGSAPDGRAISGSDDSTCRNWTSGTDGAAMVGHHDRVGLRDDEPSRSWNSSHLSRGCSNEALASSGGGGLLYCFAQ